MAAIFQCFRKTRGERAHIEEPEEKSSDKTLLCSNCKSIINDQKINEDEDGIDGRPCSKFTSSKRGETISSKSSTSSTTSTDSSVQNGKPTAVPINGNASNGVITDYTPMAQQGLAGMSYMPVSKTNPNYNMDHPRRGKAVIFNFDFWKNTTIPSLDLPPRLGSEKDKKDLADCLTKLSFDVKTYDNLIREKFDKVMERLRKEDHSDADCLVVAIMTHGEKNTVYLSDGTQLPVNLIWEKFESNKCPTLAAKPKIFIVQACRGKRYDHGTRLAGAHTPLNMHNDVTDFVPFSYVIPNAADIIVAFSCPLGHYSWRHPERGSWFIQSFCKVFNEQAHTMDLKSLLTTVSREVALNFESDTDHIDSDKKKQVPSTSSTLIRNVFFNPKPPLEFYNVSHKLKNENFCDSGVNLNSHSNGLTISLQQVQLAVEKAQLITDNNEETQSPESAETYPLVPSPISPQSGIENSGSEISDEIPALVRNNDVNYEIPIIP